MPEILIRNDRPTTLKTAHNWPGVTRWEQVDGSDTLDFQGDSHVVTPKQKYGKATLRVSFFPPGQSDTACFQEEVVVVLAQTQPEPPLNAGVVIGG